MATNMVKGNTMQSYNRLKEMKRKEYSTSNQIVMKEFWDVFYRELEDKIIDKQDRSWYDENVMILLNKGKNDKKRINNTIVISENELQMLQKKIEDMTSQFDEYSIFNETPNLIKLLIGKDLISAKSYLYKYLPQDIYDSNIAQFREYTLEAIIIYVLGVLYNSIQESSAVRASTLLDRLDRTVRTQANIIKTGSSTARVESSKDKQKKENKYEIGKRLLEFMIERKLIHIESISTNEAIVKEKGKGYFESNLLAVCDFDLSLIPLKLNLPMVCKPLDWKHISEKEFFFELSKPFRLSEMIGGYLSSPTLDIYNSFSSVDNRFSLLSSINLNNFNIELDDDRYKDMCNILNGLQKQGFQINKKILGFIKKNRATLEKEGILMPGILAHVNLKEAYDLMRKCYYQNKEIKNLSSLSVLLKELANRVQKARYEDFIIRLASAYEDYVFYLPAYLDFRGRIYRSGILHFHERDLARSLIVFAHNHQEESNQSTKDIVATSAAFKYQKFDLYEEALKWYKEKQREIYDTDDIDNNLITFSKKASEPFQFIAKVVCNEGSNWLPITQDAAASAYQIMSYFLLNEEMARRTNLIPDPEGKIQDVYMHLLHDYKVFLHHRINDKLKMEIIESMLDRKLIKSLFMPLIYGKTMISMEHDISLKYGELLSRKDSYNLAKLSIEFWNHKYPDIVNFMKLITIISWFCSAMERAFVYSIPYFTTKQDYMSFVKEEIMVFERITKKKRRITLKVPTMKRDKRKTQSSSFANFIHQKDAYIAMKAVESLLKQGAPIYTVHENFITTPPYVRMVPDIYIEVFINMGPPLKIINDLIRINLIQPNYANRGIHIPLAFQYYYNSNPMPSDSFTDYLNSLYPLSSMKDKKKWDKKVSDFVKYYNNYVDAVCGNPNDAEQEKWNQFKKLLENRSHNYSVHY